MNKFQASIHHNEASVNGFAKAQFLLFQNKRRIVQILLGVGLLILGAVLPEQRSWSLVLIIAGCLILMDLPYVPRRTAQQILKSSQILGEVEYEFTDVRIWVRAGESETETPYSKICRLAEDKVYFYLFLNKGMAYTIAKNSLNPNDAEGFHDMLKQQTGLLWEKISGAKWFRLMR